MNRNLVLVSVSLFAWGIGEGLFVYFQPLVLQEWGADPLLIGTILGGMGIMMAVAQIPAGYLTDRFGSRPIMWGSWILGTGSTIVMALAGSMTVFVVGMALYGLTSFVVAPMNTYITNVRGKMSVGRALTFISGMYNIGAVVGPLTGGLLADRFGYRSLYFAAGGIFLISTCIILFVQKNPSPHETESEYTKSKGVFKNPRFLFFAAITMVTMFVLYLPQPLTPNFLQNQHQLSRTMIGFLGAFGSLGNAIAMFALGNLPAFAGFIVGQIWVMLFAFIYIKAGTPFWFGMGYFLFGGYRLCRSMVLAIARPFVRPQQTGLAYGVLETANALAVIAAPVMAGFLYEQDGYLVYRVSFYLILAVLVLNMVGYHFIKRNNMKDSGV